MRERNANGKMMQEGAKEIGRKDYRRERKKMRKRDH